MSWWKKLIKEVAVIAAEGIAEAEASGKPVTIKNIGIGAGKAIAKKPDLFPTGASDENENEKVDTNDARSK